MYQPSLVPLSGTGKKSREGIRGDCLHWWVPGSTSSLTGVVIRQRVFRVLCNLECSVGLSQKRICAHFNEGILLQFGWSVPKKIVELHSVFEVVGRK